MKQTESMNKNMKEELKKLVLARLETLNQDSKIILVGEKDIITVSDMVEAVKNNSELGKKILEVQYSYLKMLAKGEI